MTAGADGSATVSTPPRPGLILYACLLPLLLLPLLAETGSAAESGSVMTLDDLADAPAVATAPAPVAMTAPEPALEAEQPAGAAIPAEQESLFAAEPSPVPEPAPAAASVSVTVDPLIYREDGSLYTGPMPDGGYCLEGRIVAIRPPSPEEFDDAEVREAFAPETPYPAQVDARPEFFLHQGFIDPNIERYLGDSIHLPGDNRFDHYRYLPERRPFHRPNSYSPPRPPPTVSRPDYRPRSRPEGPRPPRPHEVGRPTGTRGSR